MPKHQVVKEIRKKGASMPPMMSPADLPIFPAPRDKETAFLFPSENPPKDTYKRFHTIWLVNIDSSLRIEDGRVISKEDACDSPNLEEVSIACRKLGLPHAVLPYKHYPRDSFAAGLVKVDFSSLRDISNSKDLNRNNQNRTSINAVAIERSQNVAIFEGNFG